MKLADSDLELKIDLYSLSALWEGDVPDYKRLALIRSIVLMAPDCHAFKDKVIKTLNSGDFDELMD